LPIYYTTQHLILSVRIWIFNLSLSLLSCFPAFLLWILITQKHPLWLNLECVHTLVTAAAAAAQQSDKRGTNTVNEYSIEFKWGRKFANFAPLWFYLNEDNWWKMQQKRGSWEWSQSLNMESKHGQFHKSRNFFVVRITWYWPNCK
jgi:hypothetical protein